jgi:hypothetical protein
MLILFRWLETVVVMMMMMMMMMMMVMVVMVVQSSRALNRQHLTQGRRGHRIVKKYYGTLCVHLNVRAITF